MNVTGEQGKVAVTADEVIRSRQSDITKEVFELDRRMIELKAEMKSLEVKKAQLMLEHDMWDNYDDRNQVRMVSTTTTVEVLIGRGRLKGEDRLGFEDCVAQVFDAVGRPMEICEIRAALSKFGYVWNDYSRAYSDITRKGNLESTGQRGYYNLVRSRGWKDRS